VCGREREKEREAKKLALLTNHLEISQTNEKMIDKEKENIFPTYMADNCAENFRL